MPKKIDPKVKERCVQQMLDHISEYPNPAPAAEAAGVRAAQRSTAAHADEAHHRFDVAVTACVAQRSAARPSAATGRRSGVADAAHAHGPASLPAPKMIPMSPEVAARLRLVAAAALAAVLALVLMVSDATAHRAQVFTSHDQVAPTAVLGGVAGARGRPGTHESGPSDLAMFRGDAAGGGPQDQQAMPASTISAPVTLTSGTCCVGALGSDAAPAAAEPRAPPATQA